MRLYDYLKAYQESDSYGFHMPGHKRNEHLLDCELPYGIDITEIDGFDDLHQARGVIKVCEERAARLYHADETHFLVNGSSVGILSAILGCCERGDEILVARNCHKSVYHALELGGLTPVYLYPDYDEVSGINKEISIDTVRDALTNYPNAKAMVIVSPTYDGVLSDIEAIATFVHEAGLSLIVDEAHGAHFGFSPYFPTNANEKGADVVIHSVHKTLPSLTQTALLHMNGERVNRESVRRYLRMLQTSSPSYVLMASIDACMEFLEKDGADAFEAYAARLEKLREALKSLKHLQIPESRWYDKSKLVISARGTSLSGPDLADVLRATYHLESEMAAGDYVLMMTTVADTKEGFDRLQKALFEIDNGLCQVEKEVRALPLPRAKAGANHPAKDYIYLYPPGIPVVTPGEEMTEEVTEYLQTHEKLGCSIIGWER